MNNFEKIKSMSVDGMANVLVACINSYEEIADLNILVRFCQMFILIKIFV